MKKIALFVLVALGLTSCMGDSQSVKYEGDFKIEFLFEHDGCKVYRFYDDGYKYFTNCNGSTNWTEKEGKRTVEESID